MERTSHYLCAQITHALGVMKLREDARRNGIMANQPHSRSIQEETNLHISNSKAQKKGEGKSMEKGKEKGKKRAKGSGSDGSSAAFADW